MNVGDINTIIQLQALGSLRPTDSNSVTQAPSSANLFQALLNEVLSSVSHPTNNALTANPGLGTLATIINSSIPSSPSIAYNPVPIANQSTTGTASMNQNTDYDDIIKEASNKYHVPEKLIRSVIQQESGYNSNAISSAGASGLMQLMPKTASSLGVNNIMDPYDNIMGGTKYLKSMMTKYNGNIELTLASYNAGPGNVDKYGGVPPFKETQNYVNKVMTSYYS